MTVRDAIGLVYTTFNRAKPYVERRRDREVRHPEWSRELFRRLGNPDQAGYSVAITGSKGKGSHAIFLAGILERLGFRVGLFTGPHLVDFMERFRVNGDVMPEPAFIKYVTRVCREVENLPIPEGQYVGPVGILAVAASLWFREEETDVQVIECGRGALHDDVNQWTHQGAIVSPIFLEHAFQLGPTLADVAREKAGIVTQDTTWVTSQPQSQTVRPILESECCVQGADLRFAGEDYRYRMHLESSSGAAFTVLDFESGERRTRLLLPPEVDFLAANAAVALDAALRVWADCRVGSEFPEEIDLREIRLPGRMHTVQSKPWTVVDGTIHRQSAVHVAQWVQRQRQARPQAGVGLILAVPDDKDGEGVIEAMAGVADWLVLTKAHNPHLHFEQTFVDAAHQWFEDVTLASYLEEAWEMAAKRCTDDSIVLLLGTQSFVGDALQFFKAPTQSIWRTGRETWYQPQLARQTE